MLLIVFRNGQVIKSSDEKLLRQIQKRNRKIAEVVYEYGYSQKEVADHLGMYYSTISRLISKESEMSRNKT